MHDLIKVIFTEQQQTNFKNLYQKSNDIDRLLLRSIVAKRLKDYAYSLENNGTDWILSSLAQYNKPEEDTMRIFQSIMNCFHKFEHGLITNKIQWRLMNDVADSSLIGISFFRDRLEWECKYHGAPSVKYYSKAGALAFYKLGYDNIGREFNEWAEFIRNEFLINS